MTVSNPFVALILVFMLLSCDKKEPAPTKDDDTKPPIQIYPPVETKSPNSNYQPAFAGQTRVSGVKTTTGLDIKVIAQGLSSPWGIVSLPDGRFLITQKGGTMRISSESGNLGGSIDGVPAVNSGGQGGLLDVAIAPDFITSKMIFFTFSENNTGGTLTAVAKGKLSADETRLEDVSVIYRAIPAYSSTLHYGGRLVFDKNGDLFVSTGDRSSIGSRMMVQNLNNALGKIVHISQNGQPAAGTPHFSEIGALKEIYSGGHRNTQSLAIHPTTNELWQAELGPLGGDEVNLIKPRKNYGWPTITYGLEYSGAKIGDGITQLSGMEQPAYYWDPVVSPSGMIFYNSTLIPEWKNNLFIGALSGQHIARLVIVDNKVVGEERLLAGEGQRFRDLAQGNDGAMYTVTDAGRLYRIGKK